MISMVARIWIAPSTMNSPAWMAMARAVVSTDASSHTANAGRLTPADLTRAAGTALRSDETSLVVTGDLEKIGDQLLALDRPLLEVVPEF